jgi:hypothetical protein
MTTREAREKIFDRRVRKKILGAGAVERSVLQLRQRALSGRPRLRGGAEDRERATIEIDRSRAIVRLLVQRRRRERRFREHRRRHE